MNFKEILQFKIVTELTEEEKNNINKFYDKLADCIKKNDNKNDY